MEKILKRKDLSEKLDLHQQLGLDESVAIGMPASSGRVIRKDVREALTDAQKIVQQAREEAARIKKQAEEILQKIHEERERERKKGQDEGRQKGLAEVSQKIVAATHEKERLFRDIERDIIRLTYDIAEKIIGRDLHEREGAVVDLIRQALHASIGQKVVILVNPQDLDVVKRNQQSLMQALDASKTIQIRADDKVAPKGCLIDTEIGTIDAQLETQLSAVRKALGIEGEEEDMEETRDLKE